jgi:predicted HTH transcriptional regulator
VRIYLQTNSNHFPNSSKSSSWRWRTALNWGESVRAFSNDRLGGLILGVGDMGEEFEGLGPVTGDWMARTGSPEGV